MESPMSTIMMVAASWFGSNVIAALLVGRVMAVSKRNDPPEAAGFVPAQRVIHAPRLPMLRPAIARRAKIRA